RVRTQRRRFLEHPVDRLLPRLRQQLRVLQHLTARQVAERRNDVPAHVTRPDRIAPDQPEHPHHALSRNMLSRDNDHCRISLYGDSRHSRYCSYPTDTASIPSPMTIAVTANRSSVKSSRNQSRIASVAQNSAPTTNRIHPTGRASRRLTRSASFGSGRIGPISRIMPP